LSKASPSTAEPTGILLVSKACLANETCFYGSDIQSAWSYRIAARAGIIVLTSNYPHSLFCRKGSISPSDL
jgi:hypothetical protein